MPQQATDIASAMATLIWACINVPSWINPRFLHILSSQARISELFALAGLTFCPGLFERLKSPFPPALQWLESLPTTIPKNVWGVYVLILKKRDKDPLIYVGSATAAYRGARARLYEHQVNANSSYYLAKAKGDKYKIVHMALLAHCPIPTAGDIPLYRTVVVALEAALSCVLWAMYHRDKSYGFAHLCPWPRDSFKWKGLCSHNAFKEGIRGELDFSPEQLEVIDAATKEKNRQYQYQYQRDLRASPTEEYRARQNRNNEKQKPRTRARQQTAIENKQYHCAVCNVSCRDNSELVRHNATTRHKKKTVLGDEDFYCDACDISFRYQSNFNQHKTSKGHIRRMAESSSCSA